MQNVKYEYAPGKFAFGTIEGAFEDGKVKPATALVAWTTQRRHLPKAPVAMSALKLGKVLS